MIDSAGERRRNRADARPDQPRGEKLHEPGVNDDRENRGGLLQPSAHGFPPLCDVGFPLLLGEWGI